MYKGKEHSTLTEILAAYTTNLSFDDLPDKVVKKAKRCILDSIGCTLGGYKTKTGNTVTDYVKYVGGKPQSTVLGSGFKTSCVHAAFANACMANALDYDDTPHYGATVIPSALAVSEAIGSSGKDLLTGVVAGYEVSERVGKAVSSSPERQFQVFGLGTSQIFGVVSTAGKILGLNEDELTKAFGIAGCNAPVPSIMKSVHSQFGVMMVKNNFGASSEMGVIATLLAKRGFVGPPDILEGDTGFWRICGSDRFDPKMITEGLGQNHQIMKISFKPYPACRNIHSMLDAVLAIKKEEQLDPKEIEKIKVRSVRWMTKEPFDVIEPKDMYEAEFSVAYILAVALSGVKPGPEWHTEDKVKDSDILEIARKVEIIADPELERTFGIGLSMRNAIVEVKARGRTYTHKVDHVKGSPENDMSKEEIDDKFRSLASGVIQRDKVDQLIEMLYNLETIGNIRDMTELLQPS